MTKKFLLVLVLIAAVFAFFACGSDDEATIDGDTADGDSDTVADGDTDGAGDDCMDATGNSTFRGWVADFGSGGDTPAAGITVWALDNVTGRKLCIDSDVSGADGKVTFTGLPDGKVGFLAEQNCKSGSMDDGVCSDWETKDTYQFNIKSDTPADDSTGEMLWSVDMQTFVVAPALAGLEVDNTKSVLAGAVYWIDPTGEQSEDNENIVGCATVSVTPESGDGRYFGDNKLPAPAEEQISINPLNGFFIFANVEPGQIIITADVDGTDIGTTQLMVFEDAISIGNIYAGIEYDSADDAVSSLTSNPKNCSIK